MDAYEYLSQAKLLDHQIQSKLSQLESLKSLATSAASCCGNLEPVVKHTRNVSAMEDTILKIIEAEKELNACLDHFGMRYHAYNPLCGGLLTGRYERFEDAPADGRFTHRPGYRNRYWKKSYFDAVELVKNAARKEGMTPVEAAYRWMAYHSMLRRERGDGIIIGASKLAHLQQNLETVKAGPLPDAVLEAFEQAWTVCRPDSPEYFTLYRGK